MLRRLSNLVAVALMAALVIPTAPASAAGEAVAGRLIDSETGLGIGGLCVLVYPFLPSEPIVFALDSTTTDADGNYLFNDLVFYADYEVKAGSCFRPGWYNAQSKVAIAGTADLVLTKGVRVVGTIIDPATGFGLENACPDGNGIYTTDARDPLPAGVFDVAVHQGPGWHLVEPCSGDTFDYFAIGF